jgi:preprotein translocase subunit YajC
MSEMAWMFWWLAQLTAPPGPAQPTAGGAAAPGTGDGGMFGGTFNFLLFMLPLLFLFMLLTQKSQPKEQQRQKKLLEELKKNDRVITAGGLLGTVVNISNDSEFVTIKIDENNNTKLQVLKQSIVRVLKDDEATKDVSTKSS